MRKAISHFLIRFKFIQDQTLSNPDYLKKSLNYSSSFSSSAIA